MKFYFSVLKQILSVILIIGASLAQAAPVTAEQILPSNGGDSVAISAEWAFVGDRDQCDVYVYKYDYVSNLWGDGAGTPGASHSVVSEGPCSRAEFKGFGASVSTSNQLLIIGAPEAKTGSSQHGKIFFYTLVNDVWTLNVSIAEAEDTVAGTLVDDRQHLAAFGQIVSVRHSDAGGEAILLVGAPRYDTVTEIDAGKVYMYLWNDASSLISFIGSVEGENAGDGFGTSVTSNGIKFLASAPYYDSLGYTDNGKAYLYTFDINGTIGIHQTITDGDITTIDNHNLGISLSLNTSGSMLLGGDNGGGAVALKKGSDGLYAHHLTLHNTYGGDVSQSGTIAGFGYTSRSTQVYYDNTAIEIPPDLTITKNETDYGRDISLSGARLMVNGNENTVDGDGSGVAYSYYAPCGKGGTLEAMKWTMIGLQCDVKGAPISEIFSDLGTYDNNWTLYEQNGTDYEGHQNAYVKVAAGASMKQGVGYWIISDANATWQINDTISTALTVSATPTVADPYSIPRDNIGAVHAIDLIGITANRTTPTSNIKVMLSNPYPVAIPWDETLFQVTTSSDRLSTVPILFENNATVAYVVNSATGGYTPIQYTPGIKPDIEAGEGFYIRLSQVFDDLIQSGETVLNLLISVEK